MAGVIDDAVDKVGEVVRDKAAEGFEETVVENAAVLEKLEKNGACASTSGVRNFLSKSETSWRPEKFFVRGRSKTLDCL